MKQETKNCNFCYGNLAFLEVLLRSNVARLLSWKKRETTNSFFFYNAGGKFGEHDRSERRGSRDQL